MNRHLRAAAAPLLLGALLAACGGGSVRQASARRAVPAPSPSALVTSPARPSPTVAPSAAPVLEPLGCRTTQPSPGVHEQTLSVAGVTRSYLLEVPNAAAAGVRLPLVLSFHGYDQSDFQQNAYTGLAAVAQSQGVYVVTPEGYDGRWNFPRRPYVGPSDVAFVATLLAALPGQICYDAHRVVATGWSDGADMANTLGCALPGRIAAVFGVAPSVFPQPCQQMPPTVVEVHGTADPIVPFDGGGGDRPYPFQGLTAQPVASRMASWAALGGCSGEVTHPVAAGVSAEVWTCPPPRHLALYVIAGGGHTWPGAAPWPALGATTTAVSA
ncbi:MAG: CE1 family esterase, partial [Mycobacteriales bacterium]